MMPIHYRSPQKIQYRSTNGEQTHNLIITITTKIGLIKEQGGGKQKNLDGGDGADCSWAAGIP